MNYEITYDTQMILPIDSGKSKIIEEDSEYVVDNNVLEIMDHSCEYFGSSYEGRKEGTKKLIGVTHKSPIIIEESRKMIFFPTSSPDNKDCIWINLNKIDKYYKVNKTTSAIKFKNGNIMEFNVSYGSLSNQILRATRLKYILDDRVNLKKDNYM